MTIVQNKILRYFLLIIGLASVILGALGLFLPLLPTTPFMLLATWCFLKSSPKLHTWLYNHKIIGPYLNNWDKHRLIPMQAKIFATISIISSQIYLYLKLTNNIVKILLGLILNSVLIFILSQKSKA